MRVPFQNDIYIPTEVALSCSCSRCHEKQQAYVQGNTIYPDPCEAAHGYLKKEVRFEPRRFPDLHQCRNCIAADFFCIETLALRIWGRNYRGLFRESRQGWAESKALKAAPPHRYLQPD